MNAFGRKRDELLHFLRRKTFSLGQQRDNRPIEVWEDVDRNARQHEGAVGHQNERSGQHE